MKLVKTIVLSIVFVVGVILLTYAIYDIFGALGLGVDGS